MKSPTIAPDAERLALLRGVLTNPDDDRPRLIYADWLEEHGDAKQQSIAGFIRAQIETAELRETANPLCKLTSPDCCEVSRREPCRFCSARNAVIRFSAGADFSEDLLQVAGLGGIRGCSEASFTIWEFPRPAVAPDESDRVLIGDGIHTLAFHRGFVEGVIVEDLAAWTRLADHLISNHPLRSARLAVRPPLRTMAGNRYIYAAFADELEAESGDMRAFRRQHKGKVAKVDMRAFEQEGPSGCFELLRREAFKVRWPCITFIYPANPLNDQN